MLQLPLMSLEGHVGWIDSILLDPLQANASRLWGAALDTPSSSLMRPTSHKWANAGLVAARAIERPSDGLILFTGSYDKTVKKW